MDLGLRGKYALVTGGSHGIGKSIALSLAEEGCNVAICARSEDRISQTISEITKTGVQAIGVAADVTIQSEVSGVVKAVLNAWGGLHILVNNVGGGGRWGNATVEDTPENVWTEVFEKNAMSAVRFTSLLIPVMRRQKWGRVITIASIYGREGGGRPWFNMAKSAEISLMKTLAVTPYLVKDGITFNSVAPGSIMIPDTGWDRERKENDIGFSAMVNERFPMGRLGAPEEIASVVVFLASEKASLVNGASIVVDGGESKSF